MIPWGIICLIMGKWVLGVGLLILYVYHYCDPEYH